MLHVGILFAIGFTIFLLFNKDTKKKRLVVSLTLFITSIIMPISALIHHITGHESKFSHTFLHIHVAVGVIFVVAFIFHVFFNWKTLKNYLKSL